MKLSFIFLAALMALLTITTASALTIGPGVNITTTNVTWTIGADITLDELTITANSLILNDDNITFVPDQPVNTTINEWSGVLNNNFTTTSNAGTSVDYDVTINGLYDGKITYNGIERFTSPFNLITGSAYWYYFYQNAVYFTIYDYETLSKLNGTNITISVTGPLSNIETSTTTGEYNLSLNTTGYYYFRFGGTGYTTTKYLISGEEHTAQFVNVYILPNTTEIVDMYLKDQYSGLAIADATISMSEYINGSDRVIENALTDVLGKTSFSYLPLHRYCFLATKNGYEDKDFCLDPVNSDTYNVLMTPTVSTNETLVYDDVVINVVSYKAVEQNNSWANVRIRSTGGSLTSYTITLTLPNGTTNTTTGNNAYGELINQSIMVGEVAYNSLLRLTITYDSNLNEDSVVISHNYLIGSTDSNTLKSSLDPDLTGLSPQWLAIIATLITFIIAGMASMAGSLMGESTLFAATAGIISSGFWMYVGWIPMYGFFAVVFVGVMLIATRLGSK